ncbi:MAG: hypothetical protein JRH15_18555 [Deltaproteobacteria bacterium]|nr:hypothetical protein [Deltaproteobacteria bacterium]
MTPKQRVLTALNHQEPDRVPFDLGGTVDTSIHYIGYNNLMQHLGKTDLVRDKEDVPFIDISQLVVQVDTQIVEELGIDVRGIVPGNFQTRWKDVIQKDGAEIYLTDSFGA